MCGRWPVHLIPFDVIILIIISEEYKLLMFSLRSFLQSPIISFPNIQLSTLFSNNFS
jgi:hypothetical protein